MAKLNNLLSLGLLLGASVLFGAAEGAEKKAPTAAEKKAAKQAAFEAQALAARKKAVTAEKRSHARMKVAVASKKAAEAASWHDFVTRFKAAYDQGNVAELENLKKEQEHKGQKHKGFANINDLGGEFMKYGRGMVKWRQLIADARKKAKR